MPPTNNATAIQARDTLLRSRVHAFCQDLLASTPPAQILDQHFTGSPAIIQHGPEWAYRFLPFIGRHFLGRRTATTPDATRTCDDYYRMLFTSLIFRQNETTYPPSSEFFVETAGHDGNGAVVVIGVAEFQSVLT